MKNFKTYGEFLTEAYSDEERKKLADKGFALSDGSFPIKDLKDLKNAIQAYGRAKDQARAAKFIVKRAKALGAEDLIPDTEDFQKSLSESVNEYGPMRGSGNRNYSTNGLVDRIGDLDDILMSDRKAEREWEEMSQNYLDGERGSEYWGDLGDQELQDAIDGAESLMKKYRIKESVVTEGLDKNKPYFDFLVALRDSGATNMFGATPYLQDAFGLSKSEARKILSEWMKSFNEATVVMDAMDPGSKILTKLLKKHKVTMEIIDNEGPAGWPEVELTGDRKDLEKVLASEDGWDDADLAEYIEESNGTYTVKVKSLNEAKSKFKIGDRVSVLSRSSKKPFDSGEVTGIQKDGTILINGLETISHEVAIDAELVVKESVVTESKLTWGSLKESLGINEGRSINKVSKDLEKTVLDMKKTVDEWKEAEGDRKSELLEKLRELNKRKAELEAELNDAVAGKDHDLQLALKEAEELAYLELDVKNIFENEQA